MSQFELLSPDGEDINISLIDPAFSKEQPTAAAGAPADRRPGRPHSKILSFDSPLTGAQGIQAACSFGDMAFYYYEGDGFTIWKSHYDIRRRAKVIGRADQAVLELTSMYEGSLSIDWQAVAAGKLPLKQVQLYHAPYVDNTTVLEGGKQYLTLDVHLSPSLLEPYAAHFPLLDQFLGKVANGVPALLFDSAAFATPKMNGVLKSIMEYSFVDQLAPRYYDSHVHILLIMLLEKLAGISASLKSFSAADIEKAHEVKRLLVSDYSASYTIKELCKLLATNPYTLKTTFRQLFGMPIGKYKRATFMEHARVLLLETDNSIDEVAMLIGYATQQSFTQAYKAYWGYNPGAERKRGR